MPSKKTIPDDIFLSRVSKPIPFRKVGCSTLSSCKPRQILANHSQIWNKSRISGVVSIPFPSMGPFCAADTWGTHVLQLQACHVWFVPSYPPFLFNVAGWKKINLFMGNMGDFPASHSFSFFHGSKKLLHQVIATKS